MLQLFVYFWTNFKILLPCSEETNHCLDGPITFKNNSGIHRACRSLTLVLNQLVYLLLHACQLTNLPTWIFFHIVLVHLCTNIRDWRQRTYSWIIVNYLSTSTKAEWLAKNIVKHVVLSMFPNRRKITNFHQR